MVLLFPIREISIDFTTCFIRGRKKFWRSSIDSIDELWELVTLDCNFNLLMPNHKIILIKFYGNWMIEGNKNKLGWEQRSGGERIGHGWKLWYHVKKVAEIRKQGNRNWESKVKEIFSPFLFYFSLPIYFAIYEVIYIANLSNKFSNNSSNNNRSKSMRIWHMYIL